MIDLLGKCRTATSPVKLIKCLQAIKEYAFHSSEYPVIITFEDHLSRNLQEKVAKVRNKLSNGDFSDHYCHPLCDWNCFCL